MNETLLQEKVSFISKLCNMHASHDMRFRMQFGPLIIDKLQFGPSTINCINLVSKFLKSNQC